MEGVRVQVEDSDFDEAERILSEGELQPVAQSTPGDSVLLECFACRSGVPPEQTRCPLCGWSYKDGGRGALARGFNPPYAGLSYRGCNDGSPHCGSLRGSMRRTPEVGESTSERSESVLEVEAADDGGAGNARRAEAGCVKFLMLTVGTIPDTTSKRGCVSFVGCVFPFVHCSFLLPSPPSFRPQLRLVRAFGCLERIAFPVRVRPRPTPQGVW
jgi:hypothetical protein